MSGAFWYILRRLYATTTHIYWIHICDDSKFFRHSKFEQRWVHIYLHRGCYWPLIFEILTIWYSWQIVNIAENRSSLWCRTFEFNFFNFFKAKLVTKLLIKRGNFIENKHSAFSKNRIPALYFQRKVLFQCVSDNSLFSGKGHRSFSFNQISLQGQRTFRQTKGR